MLIVDLSYTVRKGGLIVTVRNRRVSAPFVIGPQGKQLLLKNCRKELSLS